MAEEEYVSVLELATALGRRKQTVFKVLRRMGIQPVHRTGNGTRGQVAAFLTSNDARLVRDEFRPILARQNEDDDRDDGPSSVVLDEAGWFYLLVLEPEHDPGRFKVGFATNAADRLRVLRCSAPFAVLVKTWRCKRLWEKTAIDCVAADAQKLHTEVFRTNDINRIVDRGDKFFELMPSIDRPK